MAKKKVSTGAGVGLGLGIGALAAAAASAYYLYGTKEGAKKRAKIRGWALKAKGEVLEKIEELQKLDRKIYHDIVDGVTKRYMGIKSIDPKEIAALTADLKKHWNNIQKHIKPVAKKAKKAKKSRK